MHFCAYEHYLAEWFMISNTSFAAQLKDLPKLIVVKAKNLQLESSWRNWRYIPQRLDLYGSHWSVPGFKCVKMLQIAAAGSSLLSGCWGTRNSHVRWCRHDSRWWSFFGLMRYRLLAEAVLFIVCLCSYHCKWKMSSYRSDNQLMSCTLLRVVI